MDRREFVLAAVAGAIGVPRLSAAAQTGPLSPDLGGLADAHSLKLFGRNATRLPDGTRTGVRLDEGAGEGMALIPAISFGSGSIEVDLRGKDVAQQSFVGIAFHAVDAATYDAIYFRPFNFRAGDPANHSHAIQYHSLPGYSWQKLRTDHPGKYESAVDPVPNPNDWFHARIIVDGTVARAYVGNALEKPCLTVTLLNGRSVGFLGLWVGNNSGGDFANLRITRKA